MRVTYTTSDGRIQVTLEAQGVKGVFAELAHVQEVLESNTCGQCDSADTVLNLREHDGHSYYSKICQKCGAQLDFGQHRQGETLFVKRRDAERNEIGKNGWYHWQQSRSQTQDSGEYGGF